MAQIYLITNLATGLQYVGQTRLTADQRWRGHVKDSRHVDTYLYKAIRKYGAESFSVSILEDCEPSELDVRETWWIAHLKTLAPSGYNLTTGGQGSFAHSDETKYKIGNSNRGKVRTLEMVERQRTIHLGVGLTEQHRLAISRGSTGKVLTDEHKRKIAKSNSGKVFSQERKDKISAALKARSNGTTTS